jgi:hypothetical protein
VIKYSPDSGLARIKTGEKTEIIKFVVGDLINGDLGIYENEEDAIEAFSDAVYEGTRIAMQHIGEEGCALKTEADARKEATDFHYIFKRTYTYDNDGDLIDEDDEILN